MINKVGREIPSNLRAYQGAWANIPERDRGMKTVDAPPSAKVIKSIADAIDASGLKDGMTISFHHHLRNGDFVMKLVVEAIAAKGIRGLKLAPSSISAVQDAILPYIESGVITDLDTSGIRGEIGKLVTSGALPSPIMVRSHGGRARAIATGELHIDMAFIAAPTADVYGNLNGVDGPSACGSLGYAMVDAAYADKVIAITDNVVTHPLEYISIPQTQVDFVVVVDKIGDSAGISTGALRISRDPKELIISEYAATVMEYSGLFKDGFSLQLGSGGASLSAAKFIKEKMIKQKIHASFGVGGITGIFADMLKEGLVERLFDVQDFDIESIQSLKNNPRHTEMTASFYANPYTRGPIVNQVDAVILSATEVDVDFNVNVLTGSNGKLMGAIGGHADTAAGSHLTIVALPLLRGRMPVVRDKVRTVVTPGETVDVIVTERGVAINPLRPDLMANLSQAGLPIVNIQDLQRMAYKLTGVPDSVPTGSEVVGLVEYRDGTIIDLFYKL